MNALSLDLRRRILSYALTSSVRKTAEVFQVSPNTVHMLKKLFYETGSIQPRAPKMPHARQILPEGELYIQALLLEDPDATLGELCERYDQAYNVRVCTSTMFYTLRRLGFSRVKNPRDGKPQDAGSRTKRYAYKAESLIAA